MFFGNLVWEHFWELPELSRVRLPLFKRKSRPGFLRSARGTPVFTGAAILLGAHRAGVRVIFAFCKPPNPNPREPRPARAQSRSRIP